MKWLIFWLFWMGFLVLLATTLPEWSPEWIQGLVWGFGSASAAWGAAYARHMIFMRDQLKAKDDDISRNREKADDLREKLTSLKRNPVLSPSTPEDTTQNNFNYSQTSDLKTKAFEMSAKIQAILLRIENRKTSVHEELKTEKAATLGSARFLEVINTAKDERENFKRDAVCEYLETCHNEALILRQELWEKIPSGSTGAEPTLYDQPQTVKEIKRIAKDLEKLAKQLRN